MYRSNRLQYFLKKSYPEFQDQKGVVRGFEISENNDDQFIKTFQPFYSFSILELLIF